MASSKVVSSRASMAASEIVSTVISATDDDVTAATAAAAVASVASVASMSSVSSGATVTAFQMVGKSSVQMFSETAAVAASVAASVSAAAVAAATVAAASVATAESSTESTTSAVTVVIMVLMNYHFFRRVRFFRYVNSDVNTETKVNILSHMAIIYNSRKAEKLHSTIVYL